MEQSSIKILNRSFNAIFSHFGYIAGEAYDFCRQYLKDDDYYYVFKDSDNDNVFCAFHPSSLQYLNKIELFIRISDQIPIDSLFIEDLEPLDEIVFPKSVSRDYILDFSCHLLPFEKGQGYWYSAYDLTNLFSFPFENAFFVSEPKSLLSMPLYVDDVISDFFNFDDTDFIVRYNNPGLWMSKYIESNCFMFLSFNPLTIFKHFLNVLSDNFQIICSSPNLCSQSFFEIYRSFKDHNFSHIELYSSFNTKELFYVARFLCWWINYHSEYNFSINGTYNNTTLSCIYPDDKSQTQFFLEFISKCSTSFRNYFSISQSDDNSTLKHELITPYNFSNQMMSVVKKKSFDLTFYSKPESMMILCEQLSRLFDFMSPINFNCLDAPSHTFASDVNIPVFDD